MPTRIMARAACPPARSGDAPVDPLADFAMPASHLNRKAVARARNAALARAACRRRRLVDPTTCDIDYSAAQLEFMLAMQSYKQEHCCPYPTCNEVLEVLEALGYQKPPQRRARPVRRPAAAPRRKR